VQRKLRIAVVGLLMGSGLTEFSAVSARADVLNPCPEIAVTQDLPLAPVGYVSLVESTITDSCTLQTGAVEVVPVDSPLLQVEALSLVDGQTIEDNLAATTNSSTYSTTASVHQRLWDYNGSFLLNEFDTTLYWQYNYNTVLGSAAHNAVSYHTEGSCWPNSHDGWYLGHQDIAYSGGGYGQWQVGVTGHANFGYNGRFDNCNDVYPWTKYTNTIFGHKDGSWWCQYSYWWASGFPGWHTQNWCGYGA
jgi:hypothetical protein